MSSAIKLFLEAGKRPTLFKKNYIKPFGYVRQQNLRQHLLRTPTKFSPINNAMRHTSITSPKDNPFTSLRPLFKPLIFTLTFTGSCYTVATIASYENSKSLRWFPMENTLFYRQKAGEFRDTLNRWINSLSLSEKIVGSIIVINALVFICWRLVPQSQLMTRLFMNSVENLNGPRSQAKIRCLPLLLSGFSHISLLHLSLNMYAFNSFSRDVSFKLGPEHFLGLFLSGCVFSSFISSAYKLILKSQIPSIGASGGLMAMVYYSAITSPDSKLGVIGLPSNQFSFNALTGVQCLFLFDTIGLLLRWRVLDHAAHLGGALFGILHAYYGYNIAVKYRHNIIDTWTKFTKF